MAGNPLDDTSRWTLERCRCARCRPSIAEELKDVLADANLTITIRWPDEPVIEPSSNTNQ
jgi:hypothetical protein